MSCKVARWVCWPNLVVVRAGGREGGDPRARREKKHAGACQSVERWEPARSEVRRVGGTNAAGLAGWWVGCNCASPTAHGGCQRGGEEEQGQRLRRHRGWWSWWWWSLWLAVVWMAAEAADAEA